MTSQSEWTGVTLATLFREVGAEPSGHVVSGGRTGRGGHDTQRADGQGLG